MGSWEAKTDSDFYCLGLWCADKYYWSSSVGITTVSVPLLERFSDLLLRQFTLSRLRLRVYLPTDISFNKKVLPSNLQAVKSSICKGNKHTQPAFQLYVNSRPFLRCLKSWEQLRSSFLLEKGDICAFFGGRFDGDGSVSSDLKSDCRIVYKNRREAEMDKDIVGSVGYEAVIYKYGFSGTYCLYFGWQISEKFLKSIRPFSVKVQNNGKLP